MDPGLFKGGRWFLGVAESMKRMPQKCCNLRLDYLIENCYTRNTNNATKITLLMRYFSRVFVKIFKCFPILFCFASPKRGGGGYPPYLRENKGRQYFSQKMYTAFLCKKNPVICKFNPCNVQSFSCQKLPKDAYQPKQTSHTSAPIFFSLNFLRRAPSSSFSGPMHIFVAKTHSSLSMF